MNPVAIAFSPSGRLTRQPFAIAVIAVYFLGLASQGLLTGPVLYRAGLFPFVLLHAALLWVWYAIHAKRLRDAGRGIGSAAGIAIVNVLAIILLLLVISFLISPVEGQPGETAGSVLGTWIVLIFLIKILSGATSLGWLGTLLLTLFAIAMLPVLLALGFSIWAGTRQKRAADAAMTCYFAYGSNMSRALMRRHCPAAKAIGPAALRGCRFVITTDGYASIVPRRGGMVHGVLWRLTPRDLAALNAYESIGSGLYFKMTLPVRRSGRRVAALVYVARSRAVGRPKSGYLDVVLEAAREWGLPENYVKSLARWSATRWRGARAAESGELR